MGGLHQFAFLGRGLVNWTTLGSPFFLELVAFKKVGQ